MVSAFPFTKFLHPYSVRVVKWLANGLGILNLSFFKTKMLKKNRLTNELRSHWHPDAIPRYREGVSIIKPLRRIEAVEKFVDFVKVTLNAL